jgi:hypothetical protein
MFVHNTSYEDFPVNPILLPLYTRQEKRFILSISTYTYAIQENYYVMSFYDPSSDQE